MKAILAAFALLATSCFPALALDGAIGIHDPSTVIKCGDRYYVFGTGRGIPFLTSSNGFDWQRGGRVFDRIPDSVKSYVPQNDGASVWAPDVIYVNGQYDLYYAVSAWGSFDSAVGLVTNPTLDTNSADCNWTDRGMVVHSAANEKLNAIDPGACLAPDGTLWLCYGSYHGNIELVQLDPATGLRLATNAPAAVIASESEASEIIFHNGWYYLFVNHGSCCSGVNSTYNIRVGRCRKITGPYLDSFGENLAGGGGTLFLAANGRDIGPGHFGLLLDDGAEKFSCHYEAKLGSQGAEPDRRGRSILDIRPLLWTPDDWPLPGENVSAGVYQIRCLRTGAVLEASTNDASVLTARYLIHENQKWTITPAGGGGYKICSALNAGAEYWALTGDSDATVKLSPFTGAADQLWKIDQLPDGSYRLAAKSSRLALAAIHKPPPHNAVALETFWDDPAQHWIIAAP